ncbi:unnamed protein product, partial [Closterium sp. NIES-53]
AEGDCYPCVPLDPGIAAAALGASESGTFPGTAPAEALHTFTLDSGASRCFFRDSTTLTPLPAPVPVRLADPSGGPVMARSSTVLPCPAVPSGSLSGLHLPLFSTNLVSTAALQDAMVTTTTPGGSSLYTLTTEPSQVAASAQLSASCQVAASCSCRLLSHQTLLWHHRLGHPSLPRLRGMHSRLLVSGLPMSLPPLPPLPAPPCLPCIEGRESAAPHSSFPPTTAPLQTLHMDVGGEFSSTLLRDFCRGEVILQSFMLPDSPQQNGIAERRIGLLMEVWGSRAFVRDTSADKLSPRAIPCVFLGFVLDAPGWQFYHPTLRHVFPSQDVMFDESVPFYCLFSYRSAPTPPPPLFLAPGPPPVDPLPPQGLAPSGVSQVDPLSGTAPVQVAVDSGAARGAASGGAEPGGVESEGAETGGAEHGGVKPGGVEARGAEPGGVATRGAEPGGAKPEGVEPGGVASEGAESEGVEPQGAASSGGSAGASPGLSPQQFCEWFVRRRHLQSGASRAGGAGAAGAGGAGVVARAGVTGGTATTGPGGAHTRGTGAAGTGGVEGARAGDLTESCPTSAGGAGAGRAGVGGPGAAGAGVEAHVLEVLELEELKLLTLSQPPLQPASPLPAPSPYIAQLGCLTERRGPASRPVSPVRTARRVPRLRHPPIRGTHAMTLRPSSVPLRVPLPAPPESSLPEVPDPESDRARAASPTVSRLLAIAVADPSFECAAASALVAELLDLAASCCLDYASALVAESASASPPSVGGECALGTDVLEDRQEDFECLAAARDYELHSLDLSTAFLQGSLQKEIWLHRPPGLTEPFPARTQWSIRRPVYGLRQVPREWHVTLRTTLAALGFTPSTADPSLFLRTDTSLPPFYVLVYVDDLVFATADTEALTLVKSALQKRHTCTDLGELRSYLGLQITWDRARHTITLTQSHMVHQVLQRFGFQFSSPQPTPLSTCHSLSAPPSDESVEPSGPYPELVGCLMHRKVHWDAAKRVLHYLCRTSGMELVLGGRGPVVLTGHADASWVDDSATQRSSEGFTFSLGSGFVSWRSTHSSFVLSSSCEAEIYAGAMAA